MRWYFAIVAILNLALGYGLAKILGGNGRAELSSLDSFDEIDAAAAH